MGRRDQTKQRLAEARIITPYLDDHFRENEWTARGVRSFKKYTRRIRFLEARVNGKIQG
jgi:hypothetical protein